MFSISQIRFLALVLLTALAVCQAWGQCANGDILWVSDAVNANVGTAAGGGGTGAQCAARTVAGAAYNDPSMPFGAQGALDCACQGATIRYVTGANDYGSASASWNNRVAANKDLLISTQAGSTANGQIRVEGWLDSSTQCISFQQAGCPITLDFTGGTDDGIDYGLGGTTSGGYSFMGLRITGAADDGMPATNMSNTAMAIMQFDNNGGIGFDHNAGSNGTALLIYAFDNGESGIDGRGSWTMVETHGNGQQGFVSTSSGGSQIERFLGYDNLVAYGNTGSNFDLVSYATMVESNGVLINGSGWRGGSGDREGTGALNILSQQNPGWGMVEYVSGAGVAMSYFSCIKVGNNALGGTSTPTQPNVALLSGTLDTTEVAMFAGGNDYSVSGVTTCAYEWPGTTTTMNSCPGASPTCAALGGLFIQSVR